MRLLDLFCGRWGWSRAFAARGWECVGFDLKEPLEIPSGCVFRKGDVLQLTVEHIKHGHFDFICGSSPCEDFSKTCKGGMACFYPDAPYPHEAISLFNHTRMLCEFSKIPYVMENVRGAEQWVGTAKHHAGAFYLWGNAVPPLLPKGITKGTTNMLNWNHNKTLGPQKSAAQLATIPSELANCVADYAERLLDGAVAIEAARTEVGEKP
jgi:hypothetical protein